MAYKVVSLEKMESFVRSQMQDPAKWDQNKKLLRAAAVFGGAIIFMRNFGDSFAV